MASFEATDTSDPNTVRKYEGSPLWKTWMKDYRLRQITSLGELDEFIEQNSSAKYNSWDVETRSLMPSIANVCGHCLSFDGREGVYIPTGHVNFPNQNLNPEEVWKRVIRLIETKRTVVYNAGFEGRLVRELGLPIVIDSETFIDCYLYRWLYNSSDKTMGLKDSAFRELGIEMLEISMVPGCLQTKAKSSVAFHMTDPRDATLYAAADPVFTLNLLAKYKPKVDSEQSFIIQLEHQIWNVLFEMMGNPVRIDRFKLLQAKEDLVHWAELVREKLYASAGGPFNIDSPAEVGKVLLKLGVPLERTGNTKAMNYQTGADALKEFADQYPIVDDILYYRSLVKELHTYVDVLLESTTTESTDVVFRFQSAGAPTGRFSSGGVDESDEDFVGMNVQAVPSASAYNKGFFHKISNLRKSEI